MASGARTRTRSSAPSVTRSPLVVARRCGCATPTGERDDERQVQRRHRAGAMPTVASGLHVSAPSDPLELEADRIAHAVVADAPLPAASGTGPHVQRQAAVEDKREKPESERYKEAAGAVGKAALATPAGKALTKVVTDEAARVVATPEGKVAAGILAAGGAGTLAAMAARNDPLPFQPPAIPLAPGVSAAVQWEGPLRTPTKAGATLTFDTDRLLYGIGKEKRPNDERERFRQKTAEMAADLARFRQGLRSPAERAEDERRAAQALGIRPPFGLPRVPLRPPPAPAAEGAAPPAPASSPAPTPSAQPRKRVEDTVQRKAAARSRAGGTSPTLIDETLARGGEPLPDDLRAFMETRFGHDFGGVRVHRDAEAARSADAVAARAYTVGHHVVFAAGEYRPAGDDGLRLIAHELAHVLQQTGGAPLVARNGAALRGRAAGTEVSGPSGPDAGVAARRGREGRLANDAGPARTSPAADPSGAGNAVPGATAGATEITGPVGAAGGSPTAPLASPVGPVAVSPASPQIARTARAYDVPVDDPELLSKGFSTRTQVLVGEGSDRLVAFRVQKFPLPAAKGRNALALYERQQAAGALEAVVNFREASGRWSARAGLSQSRASTADLRTSWLRKVGWNPQKANETWNRLGGQATGTAFEPKATTGVCNMDHVVELQLLGTNVDENVAPLDAGPNQESGNAIWQHVSGLARIARESLRSLGAPLPDDIALHFESVGWKDDVAPSGPYGCAEAGTLLTCRQIEECATSDDGRARVASAEGAAALPSNGEPYRITAAGSRATLRVQPGVQTTMLQDPGVPENANAAELISGFLLRSLTRPPSGADTISAEVDLRSVAGRARRTRIPIAVTRQPPAITFAVGPEDAEGHRPLSLTRPRPSVPIDFTFPYLSTGHLDLRQDPQRGVVGEGHLQPSFPLLRNTRLAVHLAEQRLSVALEVPPDRMRLPIPGFRFTRAALEADLIPEFAARGQLAFSIGPQARPLADGELTVRPDASGLVLDGRLRANLPRVDRAEGTLSYRDGAFSGGVVVESSQIGPPIQSGRVEVRLTPTGALEPSGSLEVGLPGGNTASLSVRRGRRGNWIYAGRAEVAVPGLRPVQLEVEHDGEHLTGRGRTGVEIGGLTGQVDMRYRDGDVSGEGRVEVNRGRARGGITVRVRNGRFSGQGDVQVQITPALVGRAGIMVDENRRVRVSGEIAFPAPIQLFRQLGNRREFFRQSLDIPILAVPLGPVSIGLIGRITGAFGADYGIGPGELRDVRLATAFNPLEDDTNLEVHGGGRLVIPAHAGLFLSVRGGLGVSAGVASVTGGITAAGEARLEGGFDGRVNLDYVRQAFVLEASAAVRVRPALILTLDADVTAEAGAFGLSVQASKVWHLARFQYGSNLEFGMIVPVRYASGEAFQLPSVDQIQWIVPNLSVSEMVPQLVRSASATDRTGGR